MSTALDRLTQEVSESRSATESLLTLVSGLSDQIRANAGDEEALTQLADDLDSQQSEIASAVTENTPAAAETPTPAEAAPASGDEALGTDTGNETPSPAPNGE